MTFWTTRESLTEPTNHNETANATKERTLGTANHTNLYIFKKGRAGAPRPDAPACTANAMQIMKEAAGTIGTTKESLIEPTDQRLLGLLGNHLLNLHARDYWEY